MWNIYIFLKYFTKKKTLSGVFQSFIMKMLSSLIYLANCLIKVKFHIRLHNFIEKVRHWRFMLFVCDFISIFCRFSQFWEFRIRIRNCFVSCRLRKQIEITKGACHISMCRHLLHWAKRYHHIFTLWYIFMYKHLLHWTKDYYHIFTHTCTVYYIFI